MGMDVSVIVTLHEDEEGEESREKEREQQKWKENEGEKNEHHDNDNDRSGQSEVLRFLEARVHSWGASVVRFSRSSQPSYSSLPSSFSSHTSNNNFSAINSSFKSVFNDSSVSVTSATTTHTKSIPYNTILSSPLAALETFSSNSFDAVIDCIGGKSIWVASERVLKPGGQFTTLVGDSNPEEQRYQQLHHHNRDDHGKKQKNSGEGKAVPGVHAHLMANLRSLKWAFAGGRSEDNEYEYERRGEYPFKEKTPEQCQERDGWESERGASTSSNLDSIPSSNSNSSLRAPAQPNSTTKAPKKKMKKKKKKLLGYSWISPAADVDHFGEDVRDSLGDVVRLATSNTSAGARNMYPSNGDMKPYVDPRRCVPFERAPVLLSSAVGGGAGTSGWMSVLSGGRTGVVRVLD